MKKCWILVAALAILLAGCGAKETFETLGDVYAQSENVPMQQVLLNLPEEAASAAMQNDEGGALYFCNGYTVTVQTLASGNLDSTLRETTGFSREKLHLVQTTVGDAQRYDCVWSAAGEAEDQVGRAAILDDGNYHYVVTVMANASEAKDLAETWQILLDSFQIVPVGSVVSIGS